MRSVWLPLLLLGCSAEGTQSHATDAGTDAGTDSGTGSDSTAAWPKEPAGCGVWAEGTQAADDGATRDFYNRAAGLAWQHTNGDWTDANGVQQGDTPFAVTSVSDNNSEEWHTWDVTRLVQGWTDGTWSNKGMLLTSAPGPFDFASKEHETAAWHPHLVVQTSEGEQTFAAAADTQLESSTYQGFGDAPTMRIGRGATTLLRFDLDALGESTISSATLRMYKIADYGGQTVPVELFRSSHGYDREPTAPVHGLAAAYPNDVGIAEHPSVYLATDFEQPSWAEGWTSGTDRETLQEVDGSETNGFEAFAGRALRVEVTAGDNYGGSLIYKFQDETGSEPNEAFFRYYLRFGENWNPTEGGKLPGISGTYGRAGWGGRPVDGTDGWSARGTYNKVVGADNPLSRHSAIGNYVYHADMAGQYGDIDLWTDGCAGLLDKNRWYAVEMQVRLNTPGNNDGVIRGWVDGRLAYERTDWRWRDVDSLKVEQIWMNVYHGGIGVPAEDIHLYIDNVVIASEYIGPVARDDG